jgi:hypothetical protein
MSGEPAKPRGRVESSPFRRADGIKDTPERFGPVRGPLIVAGAIVLDASLLTIGLAVARAVNILR